MKKVFIISILVLGLSSCLSLSYNVQHKQYDSIERPFTTDTVRFYEDMSFSISVEKTILSNYEYYTIMIRYTGSSWFFMDGDVTIQADDNIIKISDNTPDRNILYGGNVSEVIRATIKKEDLLKIANSEILRIQFFGSPIAIDDKGIEFIKQFCDEFNNEQ